MKYLIPEMIKKLDESEGRNVILMELVLSSHVQLAASFAIHTVVRR